VQHTVEVNNTNTLEAEKERLEIWKEELKKNKLKFIPIDADKPPPDELPKITAPYTTWKLASGEYVELYYFTNTGPVAASKTASSIADDESLIPVSDPMSNTHSFVSASAKHQPSSFIPDKDFTIEDLFLAVPHILNAMEDWHYQ